MLIYSMGVSIDGYISDRRGSFDWSGPSDEQFLFHLEEVGSLGAYLLGRRLYEMMRVWETDPSLRKTPAGAAFADVWSALPKVVFSRTLDRVEGNARLATGTVAEEVAAALGSSDAVVSIGGADLAAQAIDLVDELHIFRYPVVVGDGTRLLPPVAQDLRWDLAPTRQFGDRVIFERYRRSR